jgi:hypothetical protein
VGLTQQDLRGLHPCQRDELSRRHADFLVEEVREPALRETNRLGHLAHRHVPASPAHDVQRPDHRIARHLAPSRAGRVAEPAADLSQDRGDVPALPGCAGIIARLREDEHLGWHAPAQALSQFPGRRWAHDHERRADLVESRDGLLRRTKAPDVAARRKDGGEYGAGADVLGDDEHDRRQWPMSGAMLSAPRRPSSGKPPSHLEDFLVLEGLRQVVHGAQLQDVARRAAPVDGRDDDDRNLGGDALKLFENLLALDPAEKQIEQNEIRSPVLDDLERDLSIFDAHHIELVLENQPERFEDGVVVVDRENDGPDPTPHCGT